MAHRVLTFLALSIEILSKTEKHLKLVRNARQMEKILLGYVSKPQPAESLFRNVKAFKKLDSIVTHSWSSLCDLITDNGRLTFAQIFSSKNGFSECRFKSFSS